MKYLFLPLLLSLSTSAFADGWYSNIRDPLTGTPCCGYKDCNTFLLREGSLVPNRNGYIVKLTHLEALRIRDDVEGPVHDFVLRDRVMLSPDNHWHICLSRTAKVYCLWAPGGV